MINAAKNKCSDVSIFKGKARNVDYTSSCKLRVLEENKKIGAERLRERRAQFESSGIFFHFLFCHHLTR